MAGEPINSAMYRYEMQKLAKHHSPKRIVEVGVYCADLSRLLVSIKGLKSITLVDPWAGGDWKSQEHLDCIAASVEAWAKTDPRVKIMRMPSVDAASLFPDASVSKPGIDFWHLDGDHSYPAVLADLHSWRSKISKGGLMTGDNFEIHDVAKAVREVFGKKFSTVGKGRIWLAPV